MGYCTVVARVTAALGLSVAAIAPVFGQDSPAADPKPPAEAVQDASPTDPKPAVEAVQADVSDAPAANVDPYPVIPVPSDENPPASPAAEAPSAQGIAEVVVTAQKRSESIQSVPIAMTSISEDELKQRQISGLADLSSQVAGFQFGESQGSGQASIRGVGYSVQSGVGEGSVAIHTDGLFLSRPGATNMLQEDIARVEILRGPQGTLYGRNATGGTVNFITPAPPDHLDYSVSAMGGNLSQRKFSGHVGDGFLDGSLRVRLSGTSSHMGDYFKNVEFPGLDGGGFDQAGGRLSIDYDITDGAKLEVRSFYANQKFNGPVTVAYKPEPTAILAPPGSYIDDPYRINNNVVPVSRKKLAGGSAKVTFTLSDKMTLSSQTGYVDYSFVAPGYDADGTHNDLFRAFKDDSSKMFTEELNLNYDDGNWKWLAGAFYYHEKMENDFDINAHLTGVVNTVLDQLPAALIDPVQNLVAQLGPALGSIDKVDIQDYDSELSRNWAIYGDTTYSLTDSFRLYGGLRYLQDNKQQYLTSQIYSVAVPGVPVTSLPQNVLPGCVHLKTTIGKDYLAGRAGFQVDLLDQTMAYAQVASGYKSGGFSLAKCGSTYEPEEILAYEAGIKSTVLNRRLRINASGFYYDYKNLQVEAAEFPYIVTNNAQARVYGAELESTALLTDSFELGFNASYLVGQYTDFVRSDNTQGLFSGDFTGLVPILQAFVAGGGNITPLLQGPPQQLKGNYINRSPRFTGSTFLQYTYDQLSYGTFVARVDATYTSSYYLREFNLPTDRQDPYWMLNANIGYTSPDGTVAVHAFVKNALNEAVIGGLFGIVGYKTTTYNPPRLYGVELSYAFGG